MQRCYAQRTRGSWLAGDCPQRLKVGRTHISRYRCTTLRRGVCPHCGKSFDAVTCVTLSSLVRVSVLGHDALRTNLRMRSVKALVCKPLLSVGEYTARVGVAVLAR